MEIEELDMHLIESTKPKVEAQTERGLLRRLMEGMVNLFGGAWSGRSGAAVRHMRVLETLALGPKKQLLLVSCDGEKFLIGTGPDSVQTIMRLESRAIVATAVPELGGRS
jgi:flagellar biogenesis protein FliO